MNVEKKVTEVIKRVDENRIVITLDETEAKILMGFMGHAHLPSVKAEFHDMVSGLYSKISKALFGPNWHPSENPFVQNAFVKK